MQCRAEELFSGQYNSIAVGVIYCDVFISTDTEYYYNCDLMCVPLEIAMSGRNRFHVHTLSDHSSISNSQVKRLLDICVITLFA